jgi:hypothetical protein
MLIFGYLAKKNYYFSETMQRYLFASIRINTYKEKCLLDSKEKHIFLKFILVARTIMVGWPCKATRLYLV